MASYYKRYYRNKYKRYYRSKYGSNTRKKSWGNMKAAKQQADQSTFTINIPTNISCFSKKSQNYQNTGHVYGVFPMNIYDYLRRSEFYNSYANMYDEFKIDRVKVKLLPTSWTVSTTSAYKNITLYTAWDRTGLSESQTNLELRNLRKEDNFIGQNGGDDGLYCIVGEDITTYSSSESRTINPNTNTSITRWLNPKTMAEKSQWINTSDLKKWYNEFDKNTGKFYGIPVNDSGNWELGYATNYTGEEENQQTTKTTNNLLFNLSPAAKENPCFLEEDSSVKFKPTLLVGLYPPQENSEATNVVELNCEIEVVCTFRGLRKAKIVA